MFTYLLEGSVKSETERGLERVCRIDKQRELTVARRTSHERTTKTSVAYGNSPGSRVNYTREYQLQCEWYDVPLVEFMYILFAPYPVRVTVSCDSGRCLVPFQHSI